MSGMLTAGVAEFLNIEFFTARLASQNVVVTSAVGTNEEHRFRFFLAFGHFISPKVQIDGKPHRGSHK